MVKRAKPWFSILQRILVIIPTIASLGLVAFSAYLIAVAAKKDESEATDAFNNADESHGLDLKINATHRTYRIVVLTCASIGLIAGFAHACVSLKTLFATKGHLRHVTKIWLIVNFFVFILVLLCILIPLAFNPRTGEGHTTHQEFAQGLKLAVKSVMKDETYKKLETTITSKIVLIFFGLYEAIILTVSILSCIFFQCGGKDYESIDDVHSMDTVRGGYD